jgi:hypothetical protein
MDTPISKSQERAMKLAGLSPVRTYEEAKTALEAAGYSETGIPAGETWRTAAKISDAALLTAITLPADRFEDTSIDRY